MKFKKEITIMENKIKQESENWKIHPEFAFIEASTLGRIRTLDRWVSQGNGRRFVKGRILKQSPDKDGYMLTKFRKDGKLVTGKVHRLVAEAFIPNPKNLPQVNHKDCDKADNHVDNLEWCDNSYNNQYKEKYGISAKEAAQEQRNPVSVVNLETWEVSQFESHKEASLVLGVDLSSIGRVIKGKQKRAGNYWFADDDTIETINNNRDKLRSVVNTKTAIYPVYAINLGTLETLWFKSLSEAGRELRVRKGDISAVITGRQKTAYGYWFVKDDGNAMESIRVEFGNEVASKVEPLVVQ